MPPATVVPAELGHVSSSAGVQNQRAFAEGIHFHRTTVQPPEGRSPSIGIDALPILDSDETTQAASL